LNRIDEVMWFGVDSAPFKRYIHERVKGSRGQVISAVRLGSWHAGRLLIKVVMLYSLLAF
jgi:hypothetical protein